MSFPRAAAPPSELLGVLAAQLEAGVTPAAALSLLASAGPASASTARRIEEGCRDGSLAEALRRAGLVVRSEAAVLTISEHDGRLASALRWVLARRIERRERLRTLLDAIVGPLAFIALSTLSEPLPAIAIGGLSWWTALRAPLLRIAGGAALVLASPWLVARLGLGPRLLVLASRLPVMGSLVRLHEEARLASLVEAFADAHSLGNAASVARQVLPARLADALAVAAADPLLRSSVFSESLELVLVAGKAHGDLPARAATFHLARAATVTARLRTLLRVVAFALAAAMALRSAMALLSTPIGTGLGIGNTQEMKDLERELDSILH